MSMIAGVEAGLTLVPLGGSAGLWNSQGGDVPAVQNGSEINVNEGFDAWINSGFATTDTADESTTERFCFMAFVSRRS
jgi:hypothetical protein